GGRPRRAVPGRSGPGACPGGGGVAVTPEPTFEESMKALEEKVEALARGNLPLDRALAVFEEGLALFRRCHAILSDTEQRVTKLVAAAEGLTEEPFAVECTLHRRGDLFGPRRSSRSDGRSTGAGRGDSGGRSAPGVRGR